MGRLMSDRQAIQVIQPAILLLKFSSLWRSSTPICTAFRQGNVDSNQGNMMSKISVIMAAYNSAPYIERAILSVQNQTHSDWELIIIDDCSTDFTADLIGELSKNDERIIYHRQDKNKGPAAARNRGLSEASGEWFTILDADDAFKPDRLKRMLDAAILNDAHFVADNQIFYNFDDGIEAGSVFSVNQKLKTLSFEDLLHSEYPKQYRLGYMKPLIWRSILKSHNIRYEEDLRYAEDFTLYAEFILTGSKCILMPEPLYIYTTQRSKTSGQLSPASHTVFTPTTKIDIADRLAKKYGSVLTTSQSAALRKYRNYVKTYAAAHFMSRLKGERRFGKLIRSLVINPKGAAMFLAGQKPFRSMSGLEL
jgi:succinoglycan biosynthesis protein ExoO